MGWFLAVDVERLELGVFAMVCLILYSQFMVDLMCSGFTGGCVLCLFAGDCVVWLELCFL